MGRRKKKIYVPNYGKYLLQCRYEHITKNGKEWCNWFNIGSNDDKNLLKQKIKELKASSVNKKMHLKEEYQIIESEIYVNEYKRQMGIENEQEVRNN